MANGKGHALKTRKLTGRTGEDHDGIWTHSAKGEEAGATKAIGNGQQVESWQLEQRPMRTGTGRQSQSPKEGTTVKQNCR